MADFEIKRYIGGDSPQAERVIAGGAMEVGDLLKWSGDANDVAKVGTSNPTRASLAGFCHGKQDEDGTAIADTDAIMMYPIEDGMLIEGTFNGTMAQIGDPLKIVLSTGTQLFEEADASSDNAVARLYKIVNATDKIVQARILADPAYTLT